MAMDPGILKELITFKMPFGKYKGRCIYDLPQNYLEWFNRQGYPAGKVGMLLATMFEIRDNGLNHLLEPIAKEIRDRARNK